MYCTTLNVEALKLILFLTLIKIVNSQDIIEEILNDIQEDIQKITIFNPDLSDHDLNTYFHSSIITRMCTTEVELKNADLDAQNLVILKNHNQNTLNKIWNEASQDLFSLNLWIIIQQRSLNFSENNFRFGLNALIFHFNEETKIVTQFLGDGTSNPIKNIIGYFIGSLTPIF